VPVDLVVTPDRVIDCRRRRGPRPAAAIRWAELTEEKIAAIPLLAAQRAGDRARCSRRRGGVHSPKLPATTGRSAHERIWSVGNAVAAVA
jgi:hypothetical protein